MPKMQKFMRKMRTLILKSLITWINSTAATIKNGKYKAILFGDRFPFRYLANDYQLKYYAAFAGCSAETMAGFKTVTFLASKDRYIAFASHINNREFRWPDCGINQSEYSKERSRYTGNEFFAIRYKRTAFRWNHIFESNA